MALRGAIAELLARHSQLDEPLTDKQIQRQIGAAISLLTVTRHRRWVRRAHADGRLAELLERASIGDPAEVIFTESL
jgi:hypothetical protein